MPQVRDPKTGRYTSGGGSSGGLSYEAGGAAPTNSRIQKAKSVGGNSSATNIEDVSPDMLNQSKSNLGAYINRKSLPYSGAHEIGQVVNGELSTFSRQSIKNEAVRASKEMKRTHERGLKNSNYRDHLYSEEYLKKLVAADEALFIMIEGTPVIIPKK